MHKRRVCAVYSAAFALVVGLAPACLPQDSFGYDKPHATAVYWHEGDAYAFDVTIHNYPPLDGYPIGDLLVDASWSYGFEGPEGWRILHDAHTVHWQKYEDLLPPGEALSGFVFRNATLRDSYNYTLIAGWHKFSQEFTPVPIPEPGLAAVLGWGVCALGVLGLRRPIRPRGP